MRILLATMVLFACAHAPPAPDPQLLQWESRHPTAARDLCELARNYPWESSRIRRWMHDHPMQAEQALDWAANNPGSPQPPPFLLQMPPEFDGYRPWRDPAFYSLLEWSADNPQAAQELASTRRGIESAIDSHRCSV